MSKGVNNTIINYYFEIGIDSLYLFILISTYFIYNLKAYIIIRKDWNEYNEIYNILKINENDLLHTLINNIKSIKQEKTIQKISNLDELYDISYLLNIKFQKLIYNITKESCGVFIVSNIKNPKRSIQKINRTYNGNVNKLCDVIRASIIFCNKYDCKGNCEYCLNLFSNKIITK